MVTDSGYHANFSQPSPGHIPPCVPFGGFLAELAFRKPQVPTMDSATAANAIAKRAHYSPPWADVSLVGIAGSSGSGKSTLSRAIVNKLNLPWVVILSMVREPKAGRSGGAVADVQCRTLSTRVWTRRHPGKPSSTSMTSTLQMSVFCGAAQKSLAVGLLWFPGH